MLQTHCKPPILRFYGYHKKWRKVRGSVESCKHCSYGNLAGNVQKVRKSWKTQNVWNIKLGFYITVQGFTVYCGTT